MSHLNKWQRIVLASLAVAVVAGCSSGAPGGSNGSALQLSYRPVGGASHAGSLVLSETGSQLVAWNKTSTFCSANGSPEAGGMSVADGTVATDSSGDITLTTTGKPGSCAGIISPGAYSSSVIEASIDFPALPGKSSVIPNWTSFWLTDQANWPKDGELDAVESQPINGQNAVSWHSGPSSSSVFVASTNGFSATKLPVNGPNLSPGWHTVDIVYTKGFFAVYYDGHQYTSYTSGNITGAALNVLLTTTVTPETSTAWNLIGGPQVNSDSSPATIAVKYLRVWSYQ